MEGRRTRFSRRDFLKLVLLGTAATAFVSITPEEDNQEPVDHKSSLDSTAEKPRVVEEIDPNLIIGEIKFRFDIDTYHALEATPTGEKNFPQSPEDLQLVLDAIEKLPPTILTGKRRPTKIFLYKTADKDNCNGFVNSSYGNREIKIENSTNYNGKLENTGVQKELYGTQGRFFQALVIHEFSHSMTESYPRLLEEWIAHNGWVKNPDDKWANYFLDEIVAEADANIFPWEDFAVCLAVMSLNPHYLARLSPRRVRFFLSHPLFTDWEVIKEYQKNHPI